MCQIIYRFKIVHLKWRYNNWISKNNTYPEMLLPFDILWKVLGETLKLLERYYVPRSIECLVKSFDYRKVEWRHHLTSRSLVLDGKSSILSVTGRLLLVCSHSQDEGA